MVSLKCLLSEVIIKIYSEMIASLVARISTLILTIWS